jgi:peptidylprolyl isomerase
VFSEIQEPRFACLAKYLGPIVALCVSLALSACGGTNDAASNPAANPEGLTKPKIQPPSTLPTELVIRDITEGEGPLAKAGDKVVVEYHAVDETGRVLYTSWDKQPPFGLRFRLRSGDYFDAFEEGIEGMKVGGRRELLIPGKLTEILGPLFYVVDMLEIDRQ